MKKSNYLSGTKHTAVLLLTTALASTFAITLPGCGSSPTGSSTPPSNVLNSTTAPAGSSSTSTIPAPTASPTPISTTTGSYSCNGSRPLFGTGLMTGHGPANGQNGQYRIITPSPSSGQLYYSNNAPSGGINLGVDQDLKVRMLYGAAIQNINPSNPSQVVGTSCNYNTLAADITLMINGSPVGGAQTATVTQSAGRSSVLDFSSSAYQSLHGIATARNVSFEVSNIRSDYKLLSNFCMTTTPCDYYADYWYIYYGYCQWDSSQYQYVRSQLDPTCIAQNTPVGPVLDVCGWSYQFNIETDITQCL